MVALPRKFLPDVTLLTCDDLLSAALEPEYELGAIIRTAASVTHHIAEDKISE